MKKTTTANHNIVRELALQYVTEHDLKRMLTSKCPQVVEGHLVVKVKGRRVGFCATNNYVSLYKSGKDGVLKFRGNVSMKKESLPEEVQLETFIVIAAELGCIERVVDNDECLVLSYPI